MALRYGLGLYAEGKEREATSKRYKEEIKPDKGLNDFYHNHLCWLMMRVDIGVITKESIVVLNNRLQTVSPDWHKEIEKAFKGDKLGFEGTLKKYFLGYSVNVITLSTPDFIKKESKILRNKLVSYTTKEIKDSERGLDG